MGMRPSDISVADDEALELVATIEHAMADGVIDLSEARLIRREARDVAHYVRRAHGNERKAISVLRCGSVNAQVVREFGTDDDEAAD